MVRVIPPPLTVIVPDRDDDDVLAVTKTVTEPLFEPEDGETESQELALLLTLTFQLVLE